MAPEPRTEVGLHDPELAPRCSDAYGERELDVVLRRGDWHSWHDAIVWLRTDGMDDAEIDAACARDLMGDLEVLERDGVAFTSDPRLAIQLVRSHR